MNIIVKTFHQKYIVRPDTTWEKDNEDFYVPEFVEGLSWTPVLYARVCKPGRSVGRKFASRYYDQFNLGVLLYPENMLDGSEEGFASASCLDHTSFLPGVLRDKSELTEEQVEMIEKAIEEATRFIYIRTGDFIAIELEERKHLCSRSEGQNESLDFKIIF